MRSSRWSSSRCQRAHSCRWRVPRHQREEYPVPPRREHPLLPAPKPQRESPVSPECPVLPPEKDSPGPQLPPKSSAPQPPSERECPAQTGRECTAMPVKKYLPPRPTERVRCKRNRTSRYSPSAGGGGSGKQSSHGGGGGTSRYSPSADGDVGCGRLASPLLGCGCSAFPSWAVDAPTPPSWAVDAPTPPSWAVDIRAPPTQAQDVRAPPTEAQDVWAPPSWVLETAGSRPLPRTTLQRSPPDLGSTPLHIGGPRKGRPPGHAQTHHRRHTWEPSPSSTAPVRLPSPGAQTKLAPGTTTSCTAAAAVAPLPPHPLSSFFLTPPAHLFRGKCSCTEETSGETPRPDPGAGEPSEISTERPGGITSAAEGAEQQELPLPPPAEGECLLSPFPPPSPSRGEELELTLPPSLPGGEEQELPLPSPEEGPGRDAGIPQQPLHSLLRGAQRKTARQKRPRRGPAPPLPLPQWQTTAPRLVLTPALPKDACLAPPKDACLAPPRMPASHRPRMPASHHQGCLPRTTKDACLAPPRMPASHHPRMPALHHQGCLPRTAQGCLPRTAQGCLPRTTKDACLAPPKDACLAPPRMPASHRPRMPASHHQGCLPRTTQGCLLCTTKDACLAPPKDACLAPPKDACLASPKVACCSASPVEPPVTGYEGEVELPLPPLWPGVPLPSSPPEGPLLPSLMPGVGGSASPGVACSPSPRDVCRPSPGEAACMLLAGIDSVTRPELPVVGQ
ncbi:UNVERIFIED_CONTAM: hypothetical protein FKN15_032251 [Acipenser sinensis]